MADKPAPMASRMNVKTCASEVAFDAASREMHGEFDVAHRDCCRTAGWAFERLWGVNPVVGANYKTHLGALRFLRGYGGTAACHDTLARNAGLIECEDLPGVIGSVAVNFGPMDWALGLCIQKNEWAVMGSSGLHIVSGKSRAWGVPWA